MTENKRIEFSHLSAFVLFVFYLSVIIVTVLSFNPFYAAVSLIAAFLFALYIFKMKALKFFLTLSLPALIIFTLFNCLTVREGATVLLFINNNQITAESLIYGLTSGLVFSGTIMWFYTFNAACNSKFIGTFSRIIPQTALVFSMSLRLIPKMKVQAAQISDAQTMIGKGVKGKNLLKKIRHGLNIMSVLITWSLENGIETADSMRARGYGAGGKISGAKKKTRANDIIIFMCILICFIFIITCAGLGKVIFTFYPVIIFDLAGVYELLSLALFSLTCFLPLIICLRSDIKWQLLKLKI